MKDNMSDEKLNQGKSYRQGIFSSLMCNILAGPPSYRFVGDNLLQDRFSGGSMSYSCCGSL